MGQLGVGLTTEVPKRGVKGSDSCGKFFGVLKFLKPSVPFDKSRVVLPTVEVRAAHDTRKAVHIRKKRVSMAAAARFEIEAYHANTVYEADREVCSRRRRVHYELLAVLHAVKFDGNLDTQFRSSSTWHPLRRQFYSCQRLLSREERSHASDELFPDSHLAPAQLSGALDRSSS